MYRIKRIVITVVVLLWVFADTNADASLNLLTNGDFESGDLTGWTWTPTQFSDIMNPTVVTFETSIGQPSLCFRVNPGTDENHWGIGQEEGGILSQTINLSKGKEYTVSVGSAAIQELGVGDNSDGGRIQLYIGGDLLWSWNIDLISAGTTIRSSYADIYVPSFSGPHDFELLFTRTYRSVSTIYHYVDYISVVPEPGSILLAGLGGLAMVRRRRK